MTRPALAAALALAALAPAAARAQPPMADPSPAAVHAGAYKVEPAHTRIVWSVSHMGFSTWYGDFTGATGRLELDPRRPASAKLELSIPTASVATTNAKLDDELKGADWFDAARFPTLSFRSTRVTPTGPGRADVVGELTFHGVTRPLTLHARLNGGGVNPLSKRYTVGFDATGELSRSQFGVTKYVPLVGDAVRLQLSGAFEQDGG